MRKPLRLDPGCIALDASDMDRLFPLRDRLEAVEIRP